MSINRPCWIDQGTQGLLAARLRAISNVGAKLTCETPDCVPDEFDLLLTKGGEVRVRFRVVHREGREIGARVLRRSNPKKPRRNECI
jgi:hypothetical protein